MLRPPSGIVFVGLWTVYGLIMVQASRRRWNTRNAYFILLFAVGSASRLETQSFMIRASTAFHHDHSRRNVHGSRPGRRRNDDIDGTSPSRPSNLSCSERLPRRDLKTQGSSLLFTPPHHGYKCDGSCRHLLKYMRPQPTSTSDMHASRCLSAFNICCPHEIDRSSPLPYLC